MSQAIAISKKGIKITDKEAAQAHIDAVNGKATTHTADYYEAVSATEAAEAMLDAKGIPQSRRAGAEFEYMSAPPSAKKYRAAALCSSFRFRRYAEGWRLMKAEKIARYPGQPVSRVLILSADEIEKMKTRVLKEALQGVALLPKAA